MLHIFLCVNISLHYIVCCTNYRLNLLPFIYNIFTRWNFGILQRWRYHTFVTSGSCQHFWQFCHLLFRCLVAEFSNPSLWLFKSFEYVGLQASLGEGSWGASCVSSWRNWKMTATAVYGRAQSRNLFVTSLLPIKVTFHQNSSSIKVCLPSKFFVHETCFKQMSSSNKWRERAAFQWSAFGQSTAGNDVVATIFISLFLFFPVFSCFFFFFFWPFSSVATFSHRRSARIKKLI